MLEEIDKSAPRFIELHKDLDSLDNLDEIGALFLQLKKTLQDNSELRQNLKTWERRSKSIQRIAAIAKKLDKEDHNTDLSVDELHVIYMTKKWETEYGGFNFTPTKDENYNLIFYQNCRSEKKQKEDYARIYGCKPEQVTRNTNDLYNENKEIVVFIGDIDFTNEELPKTLKHVRGNLASSSKNAILPKNLGYVGSILYLDSLEEIPAEGLVLPETIGGDLHLNSLKEIPAEGLVLPETISGNVYLAGITKTERNELRKQRPDLTIEPNP